MTTQDPSSVPQSGERTPSDDESVQSSMTALDQQDVEHHSGKKTNEVVEPDSPPDGGYGWVCVGCAFAINAHTWGKSFHYILPMEMV